MRTPIIAVALAACLPAAGFAQKGAAVAAPADQGPSSGGSSSGAKSPSSRDFVELNPAALLVDKRKKIPLADSTVSQLKAVQKKINERNAQFYATYDSTRKWTMPLSSSSSSAQSFGLHGGVDSKIAEAKTSPAEQAKMQSSMRDLRGLMAEVRERRKADVTDALNLVPEAQKKAAADLLTQQDGDLEKLLGGRP
jgi:hypothetical protein